MDFRTRISIKEAKPKIDYRSKVFLVGSCFVENIGGKFNYYKLRHLQNPLGIFFHPFAIEKLISRVVSGEKYAEEDIFFHNETWHCFDAHSALNKSQKDELLEELNSQIQQTSEFLKTATHLIITPGTAWSYRFIETGKTVANCHKIPQKNFSKELAALDEITESFSNTVALVRQLNKEVEIIFTVSPVRHIKDGFVENQRSKAHLISAIHQLTENEPQLHYFPSYEIMMDELRDYRFYAEDMLHPSQVAIDYIWEKFVHTWFSEEAQGVLKEVEAIQKGFAHKAFNPNSEAYKSFQKKLQQKLYNLQKTYPFLKF